MVEATLGRGEFFGERALLRSDRHTASARAVTPIDLLVMSGMDFVALATSSTHFGELLADVTQQRLSGSDATTLSPAGLDGNDGPPTPTPG